MSPSYESGKALGLAIGPLFWPIVVGFTIAFIYSKVTKKKFNFLIAGGLSGLLFLLWIFSVSIT